MTLARLILVAALASTAAASAQEAPALTAPDIPPALTAPVNDFANVIDAASERDIDARIRALERASGDAVVVATVNSVAPFGSIEEMAVKMFENRRKGLGRKGQDNGVLILVAIQERKVRIEVGYGLEEHVTDAFAGQTIRDVITPRFRQGEMGAGLLEGTSAVVNRIAARRGVTLEGVPQRRPQVVPGAGGRWSGFALMLFLFMLFSVVSSMASAINRGGRRRQRRGPWSGWHGGVGPFGGGSFGGGFGGGGGGGGFGGGFGGFGGGRSGGGGASGGW